jgi:hypothetical protein
LPSDPSPTSVPAWSEGARRDWLAGKTAPKPADLFRRIRERIEYYIELPVGEAEGIADTLSLWVLLTYVYQAWDAVPYLYLAGAAGSGKTRVFDVLQRLAFRPLQSSNMTAPCLFRTLHNDGGTLVLDEAERLRSEAPEASELLSILLAGYRRGGRATRLEKYGDGSFKPASFDVFGPKAVACIVGLPPALAGRCITVRMFKADPASPKPKRRLGEDPTWPALCDDLHALALEHGATWLELSRASDLCPAGLSNRHFELWQPLFALASFVEGDGLGGIAENIERYARQTIANEQEDQIPPADEIFLTILAGFVRDGIMPRPSDILQRAKESDPDTFRHFCARRVSSCLKRYSLATAKYNGDKRYSRVTISDLMAIQQRYMVDLGFEAADERPAEATQTL